MLSLALFPTISVSTTIAEAGVWSTAWIGEFLPVFYIAIGLAVFAFAAKWVFGKLHS